MTPITDRLSALAAQMREDARQAGINATQARPAVEKTAADVAAARKLLAEAEKAHREALAVVARHELDGQEAADMAAKLDRLAAEHRTAPELPTPDEAAAAAGWGECPVCDRPVAHKGDAEWTHNDDGTPMCEMPFNVTPASPQAVAAVEQATGELVAVHGPGVTAPMTDRLAAERFPGPRHEKPKERPSLRERITRLTGPNPTVDPDATRPDTVPDALLAEGQRQARPDDPKENDR
ncbi:hypothetical protein [Actinomadura montaniterrae]|uniref:Uncharacterized protein n=1 Tax=Actinomadura montaniterrae TaxID=1803903 RepID=A0A6L3VX68_9ACTN|nr:hypothetical protein [Actinomadura montaniterrae]KAB2384726.1 hypothetical protein F9B16_09775 [Actinomadura montaniterrae]